MSGSEYSADHMKRLGGSAMARKSTSVRQDDERFKISDRRELFDLYPDQWLAIAVEEITLGIGITAGQIVARGKEDRVVLAELKRFMSSNPDREVALFYTGRIPIGALDLA
jgi:hypothetical protein